MHDRKSWQRIGKVVVNPDNTLAVKVAQAGAQAAGNLISEIEVRQLEAENKRRRKAQKRLEQASKEKKHESV